jgi:Na+/H+ antiporter NhaC
MELYILIPLIVVFSVALFFIGWMLNSQVGKQSIASAEKQYNFSPNLAKIIT